MGSTGVFLLKSSNDPKNSKSVNYLDRCLWSCIWAYPYCQVSAGFPRLGKSCLRVCIIFLTQRPDGPHCTFNGSARQAHHSLAATSKSCSAILVGIKSRGFTSPCVQPPKWWTAPEMVDSPRNSGQPPKWWTAPEIVDSPRNGGQPTESWTTPEICSNQTANRCDRFHVSMKVNQYANSISPISCAKSRQRRPNPDFL
jgi:hypothetical protein